MRTLAAIIAAARRKGCAPDPGDRPVIFRNLMSMPRDSVWVAHGLIEGTKGDSVSDFEHGTAVHPEDLTGGEA